MHTGNETSFRTAALYSKCQLAKYLTVNNLSHGLKGNLSKYKKVNKKAQEEPQAEAAAIP